MRLRTADDALFTQRVAPILEQHCVSCHHGAKPKGGLDLATAKGAATGGESGAAIVAGKPDESLLVEYISGDKPADAQGRAAAHGGASGRDPPLDRRGGSAGPRASR